MWTVTIYTFGDFCLAFSIVCRPAAFAYNRQATSLFSSFNLRAHRTGSYNTYAEAEYMVKPSQATRSLGGRTWVSKMISEDVKANIPSIFLKIRSTFTTPRFLSCFFFLEFLYISHQIFARNDSSGEVEGFVGKTWDWFTRFFLIVRLVVGSLQKHPTGPESDMGSGEKVRLMPWIKNRGLGLLGRSREGAGPGLWNVEYWGHGGLFSGEERASLLILCPPDTPAFKG